MEELNEIKKLIKDGNTQEAKQRLGALLENNLSNRDEIYYLLGNAYRKEADWQGALNHYRKAMDFNPEHPAKQAYQMVIDILEFYHKDMYNQ